MPSGLPQKPEDWLIKECLGRFKRYPETAKILEMTIVRLQPTGPGSNWAAGLTDKLMDVADLIAITDAYWAKPKTV